MYCNFGGDLGPEACVSDRNHRLLRVPVHVHVQHEAAEGGPEVVGQAVIKHAAQDQIHGKLAGDLVDGEVLAVQTHFGKQVQLVPEEYKQEILFFFYLILFFLCVIHQMPHRQQWNISAITCNR